MLSRLKLRDFRCFDELACNFAPGTNIFVGPNAQGKTSLLEAVCVLLRLQSPRVSALGRLVKHGSVGFVVDGMFEPYHMQFYYSSKRKKLALDSVEQKKATGYLSVARVVWLSNQDLEIVRGSGDVRRKFLDFAALQVDPHYRKHLRAYEKALRSRNLLLKTYPQRWKEISAFHEPLIQAGNYLIEARAKLIEQLKPFMQEAHSAITGAKENIEVRYHPSVSGSFHQALEQNREEDLRLRITGVGPHRDDLKFSINNSGSEFGSEGQQKTLVLAVKLAQAHLLENHFQSPPLLLIDDVFGELDLQRRNALMKYLPVQSQKLITTTHLDWLKEMQPDQVRNLHNGKLS